MKTIEELEARLTAQRRILMWLVRELSADQTSRLMAELWEPFPPQDGQEDPGAVPVGAFAVEAGYGAEIRMILRGASPLVAQSGNDDT